MNIHVKAALQTAGMLVASIVAVMVTIKLVSMVSVELIPYFGIAFLLGMCVYVLYNINLNQLKYKETLQKAVDKQ